MTRARHAWSHPGRRVRRVAVIAAAVLVLTFAAVLTRPGPDRPVIPAGAALPADELATTLDAQAAALLRGDRKAWLAAVDPALARRYHGIYTALRALRVTQFAYHADPVPAHVAEVTTEVTITFCFSRDFCPGDLRDAAGGPPRIAQLLTLRRTAKGFVITRLDPPRHPTALQPQPWESGDLVVAQGRRVSVGAPPALRGRLAEAVAIADRAAAIDDRYAALVGNPQRRYRVFLATEDAWRTWYGGGLQKWAAGYIRHLDHESADAVIQMDAMPNPAALRHTIQHELGHVATITGADPKDGWLVEGVAEYIAAQPGHAGQTSSRSALEGVVLPRSLVGRPLSAKSTSREVDIYYAMAHYAVECMATRFGEDAMVTFVRLRLRRDHSRDDAARQAFGRSFATVDETCRAWVADRIE